jgi:alpha-beta hydrolase superfamily lysophospholipase
MKLPILNKLRPNSKTQTQPEHKSPRRKLILGSSIGVGVVAIGILAGTWFSSGMLLAPSFEGLGKDFAVCKSETEKHFGKNCGNLRASRAFVFREVSVPSENGYNMPGWLIKAADNDRQPATGVIMLAHAGGSDRREHTRHIGMYLDQGLDVLTFDQGCAGEAPCPVKGLSYGQRESRDVLSAYHYATSRYERVYAMGASVGASAILIALPEMPELKGLIAESAYTSFERLIREAPESKNVPGWATTNMIAMAKNRGRFDALLSPEHALPLAQKDVPILFIHSKADNVAAYKQTQDLVKLYDGPSSTWYPEKGDHALTANAQQAMYAQKISAFLATTD